MRDYPGSGNPSIAPRPDPTASGPPADPRPEAAELPVALSALVAILPRLADALDRQAEPPRLAWRLSEIADSLGVSKRLLEQERAAGRLPKPDLRIGRVSLWRTETVRAWLERGGNRCR